MRQTGGGGYRQWAPWPCSHLRLSIFTATVMAASDLIKPYAVASTTFPKAPAPSVFPLERKTRSVGGPDGQIEVPKSTRQLKAYMFGDTSLYCSLCQPSQLLHGLSESTSCFKWNKTKEAMQVPQKTLSWVHRKSCVESPCFILTKTQPVSGKLPFVIVRKLCRVYVNIIVSIYLLDNLPLYFIHGFLEEKGKAMSLFNNQRLGPCGIRGRRAQSMVTCRYL